MVALGLLPVGLADLDEGDGHIGGGGHLQQFEGSQHGHGVVDRLEGLVFAAFAQALDKAPNQGGDAQGQGAGAEGVLENAGRHDDPLETGRPLGPAGGYALDHLHEAGPGKGAALALFCLGPNLLGHPDHGGL